ALLDGIVEQPRGIAQMIVKLSQAARAEAIDREPQLEHIGTPGALKASDSLIEDPGGLAAVEEIRRLLRERTVEVAFVPCQDHPGSEWKQHHLVRIPGERAGVTQLLQRPRRAGRQQRARAMRAVHVQPDSVLGAERADRLQIVERARRRRARGRDYRHYAFLFPAQALQRLRENVNIDPVIARRNRNRPPLADSKLSDRAR